MIGSLLAVTLGCQSPSFALSGGHDCAGHGRAAADHALPIVASRSSHLPRAPSAPGAACDGSAVSCAKALVKGGPLCQ